MPQYDPTATRRISRRALLGGAAATLGAPLARADVDPGWRPRRLDLREIDAGGRMARRFVLAVPRDLSDGERVPLVVLLHGLGETARERDGAWAWLERYGLGTSYDRLVDTGTAVRLAFVCPFMPLLSAGGDLDAYARWLSGTVIPRARQAAPALGQPQATILGGCSLGGRVSLDVFLRDPDSYGAWAGVQTAVDAAAGARFADRLADTTRRAGARDLFVETSTGDPFRDGNAALARELAGRGVARTFVELPGPHDQPWAAPARHPAAARMAERARPGVSARRASLGEQQGSRIQAPGSRPSPRISRARETRSSRVGGRVGCQRPPWRSRSSPVQRSMGRFASTG
ncbi:MAG: hypothetical protein JOZ69_08105 [Myxococcales bacterium]|nr:hypothetical protein [Myxococcales bacterium]